MTQSSSHLPVFLTLKWLKNRRRRQTHEQVDVGWNYHGVCLMTSDLDVCQYPYKDIYPNRKYRNLKSLHSVENTHAIIVFNMHPMSSYFLSYSLL